MATISASNQEKMHKGFMPLLGGFQYAEFDDLDHAKSLMSEKTAGFLVEPIQGEGGIRPGSEEFIRGLRQLADENDLMLVFDEVQCGVARTGKLYAYEHYGIEPDIMATAKGIGGGFPLGACLATEKAARGMGFGTHGSTYGGNPLAMAAGKAVMDAVANDEFLTEVTEKGDRLRSRLEQFIGNYPELFELVRGKGLMLGIKMKVESRPFFVHLRDNHQLLTVAAGDNTLRVLPHSWPMMRNSTNSSTSSRLAPRATIRPADQERDDAAFPRPFGRRRGRDRRHDQRCAGSEGRACRLAQGAGG